MLLRRLFLSLMMFAALSPAAHAQVKASLIAADASIQPGRPFVVALRLQHQARWHTYWINPGTGGPGIGAATTLAWTLPGGWKAGDIQWPTPLVLRNSKGNIIGNGYEGETLLPVTITPPENTQPGGSVTLRAKADWVMCSVDCWPGTAQVELTLPVTAETPKPDATWSAKLAALPMPKTPNGWNISATRQGKTVLLRLVSAADAPQELTQPYFFSQDGFIEFDQAQLARRVTNGLDLVLPIADTAEARTARLVGVLATQNPLAGLRIDVALGGIAAAAPAAGGLLGTLLLAFIGGVILNLMPCVFPVLGLKILGFVSQAGADRRKVTLHGLVFAGGVLLSFWALAGVLAVLRAGGEQLGWGFQLQSPAFIFGLAAVMLAFALSLSGVFEFGLGATAVGGGLQTRPGYAGSFFTGVLATIVATPCSAPFLAPVLGAALALSTAQSFIVFTAIALGLSSPYLLLSLFPQAVKLLPRPGAWMEAFKQLMAFPLYATVGYLVWVLAGQVGENGLLYALFGLVLVAMGAWVYGRWASPAATAGKRLPAMIISLALLAAGAATGYPRAAAANDIVWEKWSPEAIAALRAEGKTIYVDFTARWCATCQANKKLVFGSDEVRKVFRAKNIVTLKADWTNKDAQIAVELAKYNRSAVPFNLVYKPGAAEPIILPVLLTARTVLEAVK